MDSKGTRFLPREPRRPSYIDVKGSVQTWARREEEGLTDVDSRAWNDKLQEPMDEEYRAHFAWATSHKQNSKVLNFSVSLRLLCMDGSTAWKAKQHLDSLLCHRVLRGTRTLRAVLEAPAWKKPYLQAGGCLMGVA